MENEEAKRDQESAGWLILRTGVYAALCGAGVFLATGRVVSALKQLEELNVDLPQISIWAISLARHGLWLGLAVFMISFCALALLGVASRSRGLRILGLASVLSLAAGLAVGMIWAAELPLNQVKAAMAEDGAQPPPKKR